MLLATKLNYHRRCRQALHSSRRHLKLLLFLRWQKEDLKKIVLLHYNFMIKKYYPYIVL